MQSILADLRNHHAAQLKLCDELEAIADSLPEDLDSSSCLEVSQKVCATIRQAHDFEEDALFPVLKQIESANVSLASSLERLRYEHWEDESFAIELSDVLRRHAVEHDPPQPETTGYMLRGFFEGLRRHIAFEREHLMPILMKRIAQ